MTLNRAELRIYCEVSSQRHWALREVLELLQRLAQGCAVDAKPLRELALRRELRSRWILAVEDERAQLLGDLFSYALLLDRFEHSSERA